MPSRFSHSDVISELGRRGFSVVSDEAYKMVESDDLTSSEARLYRTSHAAGDSDTRCDRRSPRTSPGPSFDFVRGQSSTSSSDPEIYEASLMTNQQITVQAQDGQDEETPDRVVRGVPESARSSISEKTVLYRPLEEKDSFPVPDSDVVEIQNEDNLAMQPRDQKLPSLETSEIRPGIPPELAIPDRARSSKPSPLASLSSAACRLQALDSLPDLDASGPSPSTRQTPEHIQDTKLNTSPNNRVDSNQTENAMPYEIEVVDFGGNTPASILRKSDPGTRPTNKVTRFIEPEGPRLSETRQNDRQRLRSESPSDASISRLLRDTRIRSWPREPRDIRRLDGIEAANDVVLATQNIDGKEIPEIEAEEVNELPTPPETPHETGLGNFLDLQRADDRDRAASPPPPPNSDRDVVRKITSRVSKQGQSLSLDRSNKTFRASIVRGGERIGAAAHKVAGRWQDRNPLEQNGSSSDVQEPQPKAQGILPESHVLRPPEKISTGHNSQVSPDISKLTSFSPRHHYINQNHASSESHSHYDTPANIPNTTVYSRIPTRNPFTSYPIPAYNPS
ncbi:hypothetical protein UCRPC4_g05928 [Phaeomoniella chlamydospora]|uniref:Uncharacterized protein n=1 Tax=Phaeomoniella chlamydospora TaxID=158046 RepID=A0A0G2E0X5_PHACM|nr:hypothetical protein UCRPC4_g05928 [Phaeomoniella chlamydospora]